MPAISVHPNDPGFTVYYYAHWQFVPHAGSPAQYYGEPWPDDRWILQQSIDLYCYRRWKDYTRADAARRWLLDYGMIVEYEKDGTVRVKY